MTREEILATTSADEVDYEMTGESSPLQNTKFSSPTEEKLDSINCSQKIVNEKAAQMAAEMTLQSGADADGRHLLFSNSQQLYKFSHGKYDELGMTMKSEEPQSCLLPVTNTYTDVFNQLWTEIFAMIRTVTDFVILFVIHLVRFLIRDIIQPLTIGILVIPCDYILKPGLACAFTNLLQPISVFLWNVATSCVRVCEPGVQISTKMCVVCVDLCRAFRLVEVRILKEGKSGAIETV